MSNYSTVAEYKSAIRIEMNGLDQDTRNNINNLFIYAEKVEKEAPNRPPRLKPSGNENIAYYRDKIDLSSLSSATLRQIISDFFIFVEALE